MKARGMICLPKDYQLWPEFSGMRRRLRGELEIGCSGDMIATYLLLSLFAQLAHAVEQNGKLGWLSREDLDVFIMELWPNPDRVVESRWTTAKNVLLVEGLLIEGSGGWICPRFVANNPHLALDYQDSSARASEMSRFVRAQRKAESTALVDALGLNLGLFTNPDGSALGSDASRRVMMLVRGIDNALGRKSARAPSEFSQDLVQAAAAICGQMTDESLMAVVTELFRRRSHEAMPSTAEQVIARWSEVSSILRAKA